MFAIRYSSYLNSSNPYVLFKAEREDLYYIDKSLILEELFEPDKFICLTRPRRFGKSVTATMIASFFGKGADSSAVFDNLKISGTSSFKKHLNSRNVIFINLDHQPCRCESFFDYIGSIKSNLLSDLREAYPGVGSETDNLPQLLQEICEIKGETFMFVLDNWDYLFRASFATAKDKEDYLAFLSSLLNNRPYVSSAYMTGIFPIAKFSSDSGLSMFLDCNVASDRFSNYFGFSNSEVDELFKIYEAQPAKEHPISRDGLRIWYDGYSDAHIYNPVSVVNALMVSLLDYQWTAYGSGDEIFFAVQGNISAVLADLAFLVSGEQVPFSFSPTPASAIASRDETLSLLATKGLLTITGSWARIPNNEIMNKFEYTIYRHKSLGYLHELAFHSKETLAATLEKNTKEICRLLDKTAFSCIFSFFGEHELSAIVSLAYLLARDRYDIVRKSSGERQCVDFLFFPHDPSDDCIILDLRVGNTPRPAIAHLKEKNYAIAFQETSIQYKGRLLLVGIALSKKTKKFSCDIKTGKRSQKKPDLS
ncbi:MAG: AAA family ATPase [Clostridiales bacterium]|nr:AAA family ATPase [Clostridiales bacterium]